MESSTLACEQTNRREFIRAVGLDAASLALTGSIGEKNNVTEDHPDVIGKIEHYLKMVRTVSRSNPKETPSWGYDRLHTSM